MGPVRADADADYGYAKATSCQLGTLYDTCCLLIKSPSS
jgi:hypothetical protein